MISKIKVCFVLFSTVWVFSWATPMQFIVENNLPANDKDCPNGNTVTLFYSDNRVEINPGSSSPVISGDFSKAPGLGIQINNWYWVSVAHTPVQAKSPQNPDNSGAQILINHKCVITKKLPPWSGEGIPTYLVSEVSAKMGAKNECIISINGNSYTNAVTPKCCAPPLFKNDVCTQGTWGITDNGKKWPPPQK